MLRIYIGFQAIKSYCFPPPRPPLPHFNCFPSTTTTTFLLFSFHHHRHHISIVFPPPPQPPHFHCFPSTKFHKRLPTAILNSFCSNASCSEQQSWFSSTVSRFPCLSAPLSSVSLLCTSYTQKREDVENQFLFPF